MSIALEQGPISKQSEPGTTEGRSVRRQTWRTLLAPRPFILVSTALYLVLMAVTLSGDCAQCGGALWVRWAQGAIFVALLALDRLDHVLFGERPGERMALLLLGARIALILTLTLVAGPGVAGWAATLLPYFAFMYLGLRAAYRVAGVVVLVLTLDSSWRYMGSAVRALLSGNPYTAGYFRTVDWSGFTGELVPLLVLVIFVAVNARIVSDEQRSRARAERLLRELESTHAQLQTYSERALAATEERNRIAREIHRSLGQYLAAINIQLDKALAFRKLDAGTAPASGHRGDAGGTESTSERALRDAKECANEALEDVRRSVRTLRADEPAIPELPAGPAHPEDSASRTRRAGWLVWLAPRPIDAALSLLYLYVLTALVVPYDWEDPLVSWQNLAATAVIILQFVLDRLDYALFGDAPPPRWAGVLLLLSHLVPLGLLGVIAGSWYIVWIMPLMAYRVFLYLGAKAGYVGAALTWVLIIMYAVGLYLGELQRTSVSGEATGSLLSGVGVMSLMLLIIVAISRTIAHEQGHRDRADMLRSDLQRSNEQLREYARQAVQAVRSRNHLARELHDSLGHYLTVINVQLEMALAYSAIDRAVADRAVENAKTLATEALQDVRGTMGTLRSTGEAFSLGASLRQLAAYVSTSTLAVDLRIEGSEEGYAEQSLIALFRAAQEGLTNIQKHSGADRGALTLRFGARGAVLEVSDNGRGFAGVQSGAGTGGFGLQGIRERLQLLGGSLQIESTPGMGTTLRVEVPRVPRTEVGSTRTTEKA